MATKLSPNTPMERKVARWMNAHAEDYDNGLDGVARDLFCGGCASGMVSDMIYYRDTLKFYRTHRAEIDAMIKDYMDQGVLESPADLRGWDKSDPFAREQNNQNLLAWFGFEEAARALCDRAGIES